MPNGKPNILILWGDDIGWWNISYNSRGQMGYWTPNIDRVGNEGVGHPLPVLSGYGLAVPSRGTLRT